jgi:chorismate mutase
MPVRGVRGATTVERNERGEILARTEELLRALVERNGIEVSDIVSALFSVTDDIDAEFPAVAARRLGWMYTPLMCTREIPVPGSLPLCVRVLLHVNSDRPQEDIIHLYLREARKLRPDLDTGDEDRYYRSDA